MRKLPNKENCTNSQNIDRPPQTQQYNQDEETGGTQQVKEQEKCPPIQTKEEEIGNLPEKEFWIVKMIQNLEIKMESQINSLETRIEKMQDFGSFSLSLFGILSQVDSLSLPLLFGLVGISPVPLPAAYSSVSSSWLYCCVWGGLFIFW